MGFKRCNQLKSILLSSEFGWLHPGIWFFVVGKLNLKLDHSGLAGNPGHGLRISIIILLPKLLQLILLSCKELVVIFMIIEPFHTAFQVIIIN